MVAKKLAAVLATAALASVGAGVAATGVAQAATAGQTCQVNQNGAFITLDYFYGYGYWVYYPNWVIIDYVWNGGSIYQAHEAGYASGTTYAYEINESTCH